MNPDRIGRYPVAERIGQGGVGIVYRAHDPVLDRPVAIKVLSEAWAEDPAQVARFEREARTLARFNHPNIATIYGVGRTDEGRHFLVLEMVEGKSLGVRLREGPPLALREALDIGRQIATALVAAHRREIIHRDLKPDNVLIDPEGRAKVLDFGMAKGVWEAVGEARRDDRPRATGVPETVTLERPPSDTQVGTVMGTPGYMSPEQLRGEEAGKPADIFAFGSLLYECFTGVRAFTGGTLADLIAATLTTDPDWSRLPEDLPSTLVTLLERTLSRDAAARPNASDVLAELESLVGSTELTVSPRKRPRRGNLPARLSHFVGRTRELERVRDLVESGRLVTLTGAGGCGKSRLALEVAAAFDEDLEHGAWLVELASAATPEEVPQMVATTMGLQAEKERSPESIVIDHLRDREALLVFDNCEHLIAACAALATHLLERCPRLKILATSREALGVDGESIFAVPSLSLPPTERPTAKSVLATEAGELFEDRARQAKPGFRIDDHHAPAVAAICARLDGLPLAIELAAARVRAMSPEKIAERLARDFRILTGGARTALPRQQTMRAAFDWSYQLLSPVEQKLFRRLSVFARGATLEAIEAVCADSDAESDEAVDALPEWQLLDVLTALVEKSLVIYEEDETGEGRYRLLETGRQFGCEEFRKTPDVETVRRRHFDTYAALAREAAPGLLGPEQGAWLERLGVDHENIKTALAWAASPEGDAAGGLEIAASMWRFWSIRGHSQLGLTYLEKVIAHPPCERCAALGQALFGAGILSRNAARYDDALGYFERCYELALEWEDDALRAQALVSSAGVRFFHRGEVEDARAQLEEGIEIHRRLGSERGVANALNSLGWIARHEGRIDEALAHYSESLEIRRRLSESNAVAMALVSLAYLEVDRGRYDEASRLSEESLALLESIGARGGGLAIVNSALGLVRYFQGRPEEAREHFETCLRIQEDIGSRFGIAYAQYYLAQLDLRETDLDAASSRLAEALSTARDLGSPRLTADLLAATEQLAAARGDHEAAARFHGAAESVRESIELILPSFERPALIREEPDSRRAIGDDRFDTARDEGRRWGAPVARDRVAAYLTQ